jgi:hypothetical protein
MSTLAYTESCNGSSDEGVIFIFAVPASNCPSAANVVAHEKQEKDKK